MNEFIDNILPKYLVRIAENVFEKIWSNVEETAEEWNQKHKAAFWESYAEYLANLAKDFMFTKSLLNPQPHFLKDSYVSTDLQCKETQISTQFFLSELQEKKRILVTGISGAGKTSLFKMTILNIIELTSIVPIFISVRDINDIDGIDIEKIIYSELTIGHLSFDSDYLEVALKTGDFAIFFDGIDEVLMSKETKVINCIKRFVNKYPENYYAIASRKIDSLIAFNQFFEYRFLPLSRSQIKCFVEKANIPNKQKNKFFSQIKSLEKRGLVDFLSNPLLLILALESYRIYKDLPTQFHEYYYRSFNVMYSIHDKSKPFDREFVSELSKSEFYNYCSELAYIAYINNSFSFSESDFHHFAKNFTDSLDADKFLTDLIRCICLIIDDNGKLRFVHRSFQEYFVATYLMSVDAEIRLDFVIKNLDRLKNDLIFRIMQSIDDDLCKRSVVVPILLKECKLEHCLTSPAKIYKVSHFKEFFVTCYEFKIRIDDIVGQCNTKYVGLGSREKVTGKSKRVVAVLKPKYSNIFDVLLPFSILKEIGIYIPSDYWQGVASGNCIRFRLYGSSANIKKRSIKNKAGLSIKYEEYLDNNQIKIINNINYLESIEQQDLLFEGYLKICEYIQRFA